MYVTSVREILAFVPRKCGSEDFLSVKPNFSVERKNIHIFSSVPSDVDLNELAYIIWFQSERIIIIFY